MLIVIAEGSLVKATLVELEQLLLRIFLFTFKPQRVAARPHCDVPPQILSCSRFGEQVICPAITNAGSVRIHNFPFILECWLIVVEYCVNVVGAQMSSQCSIDAFSNSRFLRLFIVKFVDSFSTTI